VPRAGLCRVSQVSHPHEGLGGPLSDILNLLSRLRGGDPGTGDGRSEARMGDL
jgi:hypothetical protein